MELIGIQLLGSAAGLGALKLLDDQAQPIHLDAALIHGTGQIAHELVEHIDVARQGIKRGARPIIANLREAVPAKSALPGDYWLPGSDGGAPLQPL